MFLNPLTKGLAIATGLLLLASLSMGFLLKASWEQQAVLDEKLKIAEANTKDLIDGIREANKRIQRVNDQKLDLQRERDDAMDQITEATLKANTAFESQLAAEEKLAKEEAKEKGVIYVSPKNYCDTRGLN